MVQDPAIYRNAALIVVSVLFFAVIHSITAGSRVKNRLASHLGHRLVNGFYRLAYNFVSLATIVPALVLAVVLPDRPLYALAFPWDIICRSVQAVGVGGILVSLLSTSLWRFAGLTQALDYLSGKPAISDEVPLRLDGVYRLVRHPLYLSSLLVMWPMPTMSWNLLWLNLAATAYFAVGSIVEENRLEQIYGEEYRIYRRQVPWLFPWPRP